MRLKALYRGWFIAAAIMLALASFMLIGAIILAVEGIPDGYEEAAGLVVEGGISTVIRFEDASGSEIQFDAFIEAEEGQTYTVVYDPEDPEGTAITTVGNSQLIVFIFIITAFLGAVAAALGGVGWWRYRRHRSASRP